MPSLAMRRVGYLEDRHEPTMFALRDLCKDLDIGCGPQWRMLVAESMAPPPS